MLYELLYAAKGVFIIRRLSALLSKGVNPEDGTSLVATDDNKGIGQPSDRTVDEDRFEHLPFSLDIRNVDIPLGRKLLDKRGGN